MINDLTEKLLESIDKPVFIKNEKGVYIACNKSFEKFLGINKNRVLGQTAFGISPISLAQVYTNADKELFSRRSTQIYKASALNHLQQRESVVFSKTIFFDENDQTAGFIGVINSAKEPISPTPEDQHPITPIPNLTNREFEVMYLMSQGFSRKEIARALVVSTHTVTFHTRSIYSKLGVTNRVSAIVAAQKLQLI